MNNIGDRYPITGTDIEYTYVDGVGIEANNGKRRYILKTLSKTNQVSMSIKGKRLLVNLHRLIAFLKDGYTDITEIINLSKYKHSTQQLDKFVIIKDSNKFNIEPGNIYIGNVWEAIYYKYIHSHPEYVLDTCSIIDDNYTYKEAIKDGLKPIAKLKLSKDSVYTTKDKYYISVYGLIYNLYTGTVLSGHINKNSLAISLLLEHKVSKLTNDVQINVNRLIYYTFINNTIGRDDMVICRNVKHRTILDLYITSRTDGVREYHSNNPDHFKLYLLESINIRKRIIVINNILHMSISHGVKYVIKNYIKNYGIRLEHTSVQTSLRNRLNGVVSTPYKDIYTVDKDVKLMSKEEIVDTIDNLKVLKRYRKDINDTIEYYKEHLNSRD